MKKIPNSPIICMKHIQEFQQQINDRTTILKQHEIESALDRIRTLIKNMKISKIQKEEIDQIIKCIETVIKQLNV
jgi:hypothetical protein